MQAMLTAQLTPQYMKRATALATVPDNIDRCCDALLDRFEAEFGLPLASLVSTSLACAARLGGGILDVHLREMMQRLRIARSAGRKSAGPDGASIASSSSSSAASASSSSVTPLINTNEFERVLRVLRPVLDGGTALATAMCNTGTNLGPLSATFHIVSARCTHFTDCVRRRYLPTLDAAGAAHRAMAHFYMRHCAHHDPFQAMAIRAAAFHIVESGLWATLEERVMSLPFVAMVMRRRQAPAVFAQLVRAYNTLQPIVAAATAAAATRAAIIGGGGAGAAAASAASATSSTGAGAAASAGSAKLVPAPPAGTNKKPARPTVGGAPTTPATPVVTAASNNNNNNSNAAAPALAHAQVALLQLLREYIYFIRRHFRALNAVPHLVAQVAILLPVDSALHIAASELLAKRGVGRLVPVLGRTRNANLHHALVSACQFTPSGLRIASGAHDGTVKVCNVMGEVVHTIRDAADKVNFVRYSQTSRYIVAASENHVVLVIDAASGQTVSKIQGHAGTVRCIAMTARGRNVLVGYEDRELWVWDSETGRHVSTIGHHAIAPQGSQFGGVNGIIPHPTDERIVYTICERRLLGSRILHAEAEGQPQFESTLNIVAHNTQPLAADSCFVVCDGSFALLCARDLVAQPPTFVRSEANVKIVSLHTGRMIAALVMELGCAGNRPSAVCAIVSPDERWIVTGALDGAMRVYQPDWRTYATIDDAGLPEPTSVRPARVMRGFDDAPPRLMRFAFDSKSFIATCGSVARVWPVQAAAAAANTAAKTLAQQSDDGMMAGCDVEARIEFVTPGATITCCDWSPNPSDDGAQIVIGDDRGKLYCLREESA